MALLLDTHVFLWFLKGDSRLGIRARELIEASEEQCLLSIASAWEMAIKQSLGRLGLNGHVDDFVAAGCELNHIELVPLSLNEIAHVVSLPFYHRDPFDRLLAAQCLTNGWALLSADAAFDAYGVRRLW